MRFRHYIAAALAAFSLTGCAIGGSFSPGERYESDLGDQAVVVITEAAISSQPGAREEFMALSRKVSDSLESRPGYLGSAFRFEVLGTKVWTMTAWTNEQSVNDFMFSGPHHAAIGRTFVLVDDGRFARTTIPRDQMPMSWEDAMTLLDTDGRNYFE